MKKLLGAPLILLMALGLTACGGGGDGDGGGDSTVALRGAVRGDLISRTYYDVTRGDVDLTCPTFVPVNQGDAFACTYYVEQTATDPAPVKLTVVDAKQRKLRIHEPLNETFVIPGDETGSSKPPRPVSDKERIENIVEAYLGRVPVAEVERRAVHFKDSYDPLGAILAPEYTLADGTPCPPEECEYLLGPAPDDSLKNVKVTIKGDRAVLKGEVILYGGTDITPWVYTLKRGGPEGWLIVSQR